MNKSALENYPVNLEKGPECPYCGERAVLHDSTIVYNGQSFGKVWVCWNYPDCDAYVGVHKEGKYQNCPLGRLANLELRKAKVAAHGSLDHLWKSRLMERKAVYAWLQKATGLSAEDCHIGEMDVQMCYHVKGLADKKAEEFYDEDGFQKQLPANIF